MSTVINPHDSFFRETFGRKEIAASFLREYLPEGIACQLDMKSLALVKDSYVDKELQHHFSDLLYSVQHRQGRMYLYFLFEHKSSPDPWIGLQLLRYQVKIWEQHRKQHPKEKKLPAIVPLVLYHGRQQWRVSQRFRPLIEPDSNDLDQFIPDFSYQLLDLSTMSDDQVRGEVLERITLLLLKHIFNPALGNKLPEILTLLQEVDAKQDVLEILEVLLRYVVKATSKFDETEIKDILKKSFIEEDVMQDFIDKYVELGVQQGMQQGMQQGQGKMLTAQLTHRFGTLPDWVTQKIAEAEAGALEKWSLNIFSASSMNEVFH